MGVPDKWHFLRLENGAVSKKFTFQYNPTEDTESISTEYEFDMPPGGILPKAIFTSIGERSFRLNLFLDATGKYDAEKRGVGSQISFLQSLVLPDVERHLAGLGQFVSPPEVHLVRGDSWMVDIIPVVVTEVTVRVIRRNRVRHPTRAKVDMSLRAVFTSAEDNTSWLLALDEERRRVEIDES